MVVVVVVMVVVVGYRWWCSGGGGGGYIFCKGGSFNSCRNAIVKVVVVDVGLGCEGRRKKEDPHYHQTRIPPRNAGNSTNGVKIF